jgi:hypothetical protein
MRAPELPAQQTEYRWPGWPPGAGDCDITKRSTPTAATEQVVRTGPLESLPEKYRTVLILRDVQHFSINETKLQRRSVSRKQT